MKLNIGCGSKYKDGFINLDINKNYKADVYHDLNSIPYPFKDNQFDYIFSEDVLEHLDNTIDVLNELHRISKNNATVEFHLPHANSKNTVVDFTHKRTFAIGSFSRVCDNVENGRGYIRNKFDLVSEVPIKGGVGKFLPHFMCKKIWSIIGEIYSCLIVKLKVKKEIS